MSQESASAAVEATAAEAVAEGAGETLVTAPAAEGKTAHEGEAEAPEAGGEAEAGSEVAEGEADEAEESKPEGAPESYADFTMPGGITLDSEMADQFKTVAKELNLPQDAAQRVVDLAAQMRQRDAEAIVAIRAEWVDQTKSDKEIGGDKLDATLGVARRAVETYGSPAFKTLLNESGLGNHPEVVRFMAKVGKTVAEDKPVTGNGTSGPGSPGTTTERLAAKLYGSSKE